MRWGYGGRWRSCDGEERGGGELNAPRMKNGERRARATLTMDESRNGGERLDSNEIWTRTAMRLRTAVAVRSGRGKARRRWRFRTAGRNGAVGTPARGPDSAFNALERHGAWQPRGNGALLGGLGADSDV
jgi:hypothetical protein